MSVDLTKRQREIFDYIRRYLRKYGYPPTVREIGNALGLHSPSTVHAHLAKLEQIGMLRRDPTKPRAIELMVGKARRALKGPGIPVVGNVAAGEPILAEENIEDYYELPSVIGGEGDDYILKVRGDSMKDAGILGGDFVVVRPTDEAANGEIVVALLGDEATVKRFYRERNAIRLEPENEAHEPIRTQDAELLGKVIGVFRQV
jgi:repressor LexA